MVRHPKLLLHIPHSSASFPAQSGHTFQELDLQERLLIDYFTDELFLPQQETPRICAAVFPFCRLYCDVERLVNDPLSREGLGIRYERRVTAAHGTRALRAFSSREEAFNLYADFHASVAKQLFAMGQGTMLVDCHSFSALPNLLNSNPPDIDICIGFNDDETRPSGTVTDALARHFRSRGYKVGINAPFSNSKTFAVPLSYHSLMIEVNKRLYMDERSGTKTEGFLRLRQDIQDAFALLLGGN